MSNYLKLTTSNEQAGTVCESSISKEQWCASLKRKTDQMPMLPVNSDLHTSLHQCMMQCYGKPFTMSLPGFTVTRYTCISVKLRLTLLLCTYTFSNLKILQIFTQVKTMFLADDTTSSIHNIYEHFI